MFVKNVLTFVCKMIKIIGENVDEFLQKKIFWLYLHMVFIQNKTNIWQKTI